MWTCCPPVLALGLAQARQPPRARLCCCELCLNLRSSKADFVANWFFCAIFEAGVGYRGLPRSAGVRSWCCELNSVTPSASARAPKPEPAQRWLSRTRGRGRGACDAPAANQGRQKEMKLYPAKHVIIASACTVSSRALPTFRPTATPPPRYRDRARGSQFARSHSQLFGRQGKVFAALGRRFRRPGVSD